MSEAIQKADHARRILDDDLVKFALSKIKTESQGLFFQLGSQAREEREFLHLMDRARQQFENVFLILIAGGDVSRHELAHEYHTQARLDAIRDRVRSR
jgi:hypothetical protein